MKKLVALSAVCVALSGSAHAFQCFDPITHLPNYLSPHDCAAQGLRVHPVGPTVNFDVIRYRGQGADKTFTAQSADDMSLQELQDALFRISEQVRVVILNKAAANAFDEIAKELGERKDPVAGEMDSRAVMRNQLLGSKIAALKDAAQSLRR